MRGHRRNPRANQVGACALLQRTIRICKRMVGGNTLSTTNHLYTSLLVLCIVFGGLYYELHSELDAVHNELDEMKRQQSILMGTLNRLSSDMMKSTTNTQSGSEISAQSVSSFNLWDDINVAVHQHHMNPLERIRLLELKVDSANNWAKDPFFAFRSTSTCKKLTKLKEFAPEEEREDGDWSLPICLDDFSSPVTDGKDCLIYDFGIRQQPHFGQMMASHFGCEVHAFDPSAVSVDWYHGLDADHPLKTMDNYHFHEYGVGPHDGITEMYEYNWGQVSTIRYPKFLYDCGPIAMDISMRTQCEKTRMKQETIPLDIKTMKTIRKELGHEDRDIDVVKIDVEGSEYGFLYSIFDDYVCPDFIKQVSLEWHHFAFDSRFGEGSSPHINQLSTLMHACGLKTYWQHGMTGWRSLDKIYDDLNMQDVRYNLQAFHRSA